MRFEHLIEINDPLHPLIESLSREQIWNGLMWRVEQPEAFLPGLESCEILERSEGKVERVLHFGPAAIRDTVTFERQQWVCFTSAANAEHAGGSLTIRLEEPAPQHFCLRFIYQTTLADNPASGDVQVAEFIKAAYRESDLDTVRLIRMLAANATLQ